MLRFRARFACCCKQVSRVLTLSGGARGRAPLTGDDASAYIVPHIFQAEPHSVPSLMREAGERDGGGLERIAIREARGAITTVESGKETFVV